MENVTFYYYRFMSWFKATSPELFAKYQLHINVPAAGTTITAKMEDVPLADRQQLQHIIDEYNKSMSN